MSVRARPSAPQMPSCVAVARRTLNPFAQVRILARQPVYEAHSSRGLGRVPLKDEITGSNPVCATKSQLALMTSPQQWLIDRRIIHDFVWER
jgi:hypothetical protein